MRRRGRNFPGARRPVSAAQNPVESGPPVLPDELIHKVKSSRQHDAQLMLHIHFTDEKITYVRVGVSVVDSEDLYEPTYRDLENVFRYIKGESRNDGTVQLMHAPTLERLDVDVESLLSSLEGLMQKKKSVGKILTTWSEKRHAQREKDINEIADEVDERHPDVKTSNGKKPARSLDAFLEGLDDMLDPPDSLPPAVRPLGD